MPPIDIQDFRNEQGGDTEKLKDSQRRRFCAESEINAIVELDKKCRSASFTLDHQRRVSTLLSKEIATLRKAKKNADEKQSELKLIKIQIKKAEEELKILVEKRTKLLNNIGNYVHPSVPVSKDEEENKLIRKWGDLKNFDFDLLHHHELLYRIGGYEPERGVAVAGHRGYFLTGPGVELNMALQNFGMSFLLERGYTAVQPPYFMNGSVMAQTCQLSQFHEELYAVTFEHQKNDSNKNSEKQNDKNGEKQKDKNLYSEKQDETKYLIATSEQPLSSMHQKEWIHPNNLPIKYAGISTCFRKEAGAHGKDAWGIFRVHQFEKIEQFVYCSPDKSWEMHEEMIKIAEEFYKELELPYRIVSIVSGELNKAAAKKYDLEGHFPTLNRYRELVSCSNCTDYQSRALNIRYGQMTGKKVTDAAERKKKFVHLLNSTLCATTRTICCILENYQTENGVNIPKKLQKFMGGKSFFPFVRAMPANKTKLKMNKATKKKLSSANHSQSSEGC